MTSLVGFLLNFIQFSSIHYISLNKKGKNLQGLRVSFIEGIRVWLKFFVCGTLVFSVPHPHPHGHKKLRKYVLNLLAEWQGLFKRVALFKQEHILEALDKTCACKGACSNQLQALM